MPPEFRSSIFSLTVILLRCSTDRCTLINKTGKEFSYRCQNNGIELVVERMIELDSFSVLYWPEIKYVEHNEKITASCDGYRGYHGYKIASFVLLDVFAGFPDEMKYFCDDCAKNLVYGSHYELRKQIIVDLTSINKDVANIVLSYVCFVPFTFAPIQQLIEQPIKEKKLLRIQTSVIVDWIQFLSSWDSRIVYFINCNPENKFYGQVVSVCNDVNLQIDLEGNISDFKQKFTKQLLCYSP